jgi:predicted dehydrogenase
MIATDRGEEHVERCRPFIDHGIPIFVDKPLVDNEADLSAFCRRVVDGAKIMSSSCMRYCREYLPYRNSSRDLGAIRFASITTDKSWERYGIHALEGIYTILGPGFLTVRNTGNGDRNIVHLKHRSGADVVVAASQDMHGAFGVLSLCGTAGFAQTAVSDFFFSFKAQLEAFVSYVRSGVRPFPFAETVELMQMVIAGIRSRQEGGREIALDEICPECMG